MTIQDLEKIYNKEHLQAGNTDNDFYQWAIGYLLKLICNNRNIIKRHLKGIEKALKQLE